MILQQTPPPTSTLPARPERPFKYIWPVAVPDGSLGYDRPLENYFDISMASRLLPSHRPARLYDAVARAHDHQYQVSPNMIDPSSTQTLNHRDRRRSLANLPGNAPEYMGIIPDVPGWRPRRSSYEDRRGAVMVAPSEVNTLVPYIPPIDTTMPPPSKESLDAMAKRFLADAHADFDNAHRKNASETAAAPPSVDDNFTFDYDSDNPLDGPVSAPHLHVGQPPQQEHASRIETECISTTDEDTDTDTDTDTDMSSDDGYDWSTGHQFHFPDSKWIIPRKRPSVVIVDNKDVARSVSPPSSSDVHARKRRREETSAPYKRATKTPKRDANDSPARHGGKGIPIHPITKFVHSNLSESAASSHTSSIGSGTATPSRPPVSSIAATALQMKHVRIASPSTASPPLIPQSNTAAPSKPTKLFPCHLDGCVQICASAGDLQRHQQSLRHRAPSHSCLACGKSYTRSDALKRHFNSKAACKKEHATKLANEADLEQVRAEANTEAV